MGLLEQINDYKKREEELIAEHYDRNRSIWTIPGTMRSCECDTDFLLDEKVLNIYKKALSIPDDMPGHRVEQIMREQHVQNLIPCDHRLEKDIHIPASEEETKNYRDQVRQLRWNRQMLEEEQMVTQPLNPNQPMDYVPTDQGLKLMPLVSRRKHPEYWSILGKSLPDGSEFIFHEAKTSLVCNCTDEQLKESINHVIAAANEIMPKGETTYYPDTIRNMHNMHLENGTNDTPVPLCKNPVEVKEPVLKHRIGNINCKACLDKMTKQVTSTETAAIQANKLAISAGTKDTEYCPRFIPLLRKLPMKEYFKAMRIDVNEELNAKTAKLDRQKTCYAGLLHSAMSIVTETVEILAASQMSTEALESGAPIELVEKTYLIIEKRCDTCGYSDTTKSELTGYSHKIQPNEILGEQANEEIAELTAAGIPLWKPKA